LHCPNQLKRHRQRERFLVAANLPMLLPDGTNLCQPLAAQCERVAHDPAHIVLDAAAATVAAIQATTAGLYNITDDEPAPVSVWLPFLARVLDAKALNMCQPGLPVWHWENTAWE